MNNFGQAAAAERSLSVAARPDVTAQPMEFQGRRYWNLKDPLALRYYQLSEEEMFLWRHLDGARSWSELQQLFQRRFAPRRISLAQLQAFVGLLHQEGLTRSSSSGQGERLLRQHRDARRLQRQQALANVLAIRLPGVDPEPWLNWLYPKVRWAFTAPALLLAAALVLLAMLMVAVRFETFVGRLPEIEGFLSPENVIGLAIVLAVCKILHELGHALTCKHFGGECHEMGLMFLVFTPCLYCNVSDAWMLPNKWQRIAITAAGMGVELVLAACATFLWWSSQPGLLHSLCLNVMLVCTVSTLLFNGNPLLRYDGYFILSDLVEVPNLWPQAWGVLQEWAGRFWGRPSPTAAARSLAASLGLAAYGVSSLVYRGILLVGILVVVYQALLPYRLQVLAQVLGMSIVVGMAAGPLTQAAKTWRGTSRWQRSDRRQAARAWIVFMAVVAALLWLPVDRRLTAPVVMEPADAVKVYVTVAGNMVEQATPGQPVRQGELLARLENAGLERQVLRLEGECAVQRQHLEQLKLLQLRDRDTGPETAGSLLLTAEEALAASQEQLLQVRSDLERLSIVAPRDGIVLPPRVAPAEELPDELPDWSGVPLDPCNLGAFLEPGTLLCWIGDPNQLQGLAFVARADIDRLSVGQRVRITLDELHQQTLEGQIAAIAQVETEDLPPELIAKRQVPAREDLRAARPPGGCYVVRVALPPLPQAPPLWSSGRARIDVPGRSLGRLLYEYLCDTFRVDL